MDLHSNFLEIFTIMALHALADCDIYDRGNCPKIVQNSNYHVATHAEACYVFVDSEKYWDEARNYCWRMGGEMLHVQSSDTMHFIKKQLGSSKLDWDSNGVWNGASDLRGRGWEWTTGETLKYNYWAEGEPSKVFGILSVENCACMRRSDGWRWHDYHCHMNMYEYNFICQFPFVHKESGSQHHTNPGAPLEVTDDTVAVIGLAIGGVVLLVILCAAIMFLYRKHEHQKAQAEHHVIRFQNTGYATIIQDVSRDWNSDQNTDEDSHSTRPISNVYLDPIEVNRIYEEVKKDNNHGMNSLGDSSQTTRLVYTGGAALSDDMEAGYMSNTPSEASGATSGYSSTMDRRSGDSEYIEMNGANGVGKGNVAKTPTPCGGATGFSGVSDSKAAQKNVPCQNDLKASNVYVTASNTFTQGKLNKSSLCSKDSRPTEKEMHIYTNQLEALDNSARPLPPLPVSQEEY